MESKSLLLSLFFCHFLADYTHLSTNWMLNAKRFGSPAFPILCHALVHTVLMSIVMLMYGVNNWLLLASLQLTSHFLIDVLKGKMNLWFTFLQSPANKWHWVVFGFDQFLHAFIIINMVYLAR